MIHMGYDVWFVPRTEWGARPPRSVTWFTPSYGSTTHWEGPHMGEFGHEVCAENVRKIQNYHMDSKGWQDIAYTSVHCPHGYVFEGRWLGVRTAANGTSQGNDTAYATCYLSGEGDLFTEQGERSIRLTQDYLDQFGSAGSGRNCHRDWKATACPGDVICSWVKAGQPITTLGEPPIEKVGDDMPYLIVRGNADPATFAVEGLHRMYLNSQLVVNEFVRSIEAIDPELVKYDGRDSTGDVKPFWWEQYLIDAIAPGRPGIDDVPSSP